MEIQDIRNRNDYLKSVIESVKQPADDILFRCSSLSHLMVDPQGKTNYEKWEDACVLLGKVQSDYDNLKTKDGKRGIGYLAKIEELKTAIPQLEKKKHIKELSESTKTHLVDVYVSHVYGRFTEIKAKMLDKGNDVEEDSITAISRHYKTFLRKNEAHLKNEYLKGTPDLFEGESIMNAKIVRDAKSSWDIFTFNRAKHKELDRKYYWQLQGYSALTRAKELSVNFCLINTPYYLVEGEMRRESYNHEDGNTPNWIELQIIANHVYDKPTFEKYISRRGIDINTDDKCKAVYYGFVEVPLSERHHPFEFERNDDDIDRLYQRIKECRTWMNENLFNNSPTQTIIDNL